MPSRTRPPTGSTGFQRTDVASTLILDDSSTRSAPASTVASTLSPSLLSDLRRFSEDPVSADLLPVVAASMRHGKSLVLDLELDDREIRLAVNPRQQLYHCDQDICALPDRALAGLRLLRVEPHSTVDARVHRELRAGPLRPLLWHLAMRGARAELLPEISGPIRCRMAHGVSLNGLPMYDAMQKVLQRMTAAPVSLDDLVAGTPLDRPAVQRIWNALYLQSALMISRALPR